MRQPRVAVAVRRGVVFLCRSTRLCSPFAEPVCMSITAGATGMQQQMFDEQMGGYDGMDPMLQQQMMQMQMLQQQGLDPYAGMDIEQQEMMERQ
jgi:hypothetical protein